MAMVIEKGVQNRAVQVEQFDGGREAGLGVQSRSVLASGEERGSLYGVDSRLPAAAVARQLSP